MKIFIVTLFTIFCILVTGVAGDPKPTGGANCTSNINCSGVGTCDFSNSTGVCVCPKDRGDPDCSYERIDRNLAGGLQFLCFVGAGGVGNFVLGRTAEAVVQLILLLAEWFIIIAGCGYCCGMICCAFCGDTDNDTFEKCAVGGGATIWCIAVICIAAILAGWIWCIVDGAMIINGSIDDGRGYATFS